VVLQTEMEFVFKNSIYFALLVHPDEFSRPPVSTVSPLNKIPGYAVLPFIKNTIIKSIYFAPNTSRLFF
jgi:hypothetical protein